MELESFLGEWKDSMGNKVTVDWAWPGNRGGQLEVLLIKSGRDDIRLNVKRYSDGRFTCGHYDLEERESNDRRIVWQDAKNRRNFSTWERVGEPPPRSERRKGSWGRWRGEGGQSRDWEGGGRSERDSWSSRGARYEDWRHRDDGWRNGDRERR
eukprot:CAMPEP_0179117740 /NCGR_PEP_ID=MMETSP0796-20121207/55320_1 /TAXON_ID=73915 /ORGANISM="Pyrodinium bahamense, Strain pbaha01" /LENGTH=153 /DNA_ID=CAMNT_0020816129 /DNA_START=33 /DNA_END=491 /DNA_ORIENTATION=-